MLRFAQECVNAFTGGFIQGAKDAIAIAYSIWLKYETMLNAAIEDKKE